MLSVWGEPVVSPSLDYSLLRSPCSNRTLRPNNHSHHSPSSSHTHSDTMASKSAVPSHLKAENGSDRHHGKTQSHVVRTEHSFFSFSSCRYGAGKGGSSAAAEWQWATEHDSSEHLSNTAGDDGRILCMQQRHARSWHLALSDGHIRPGRRLISQQLRLAELEWCLA